MRSNLRITLVAILLIQFLAMCSPSAKLYTEHKYSKGVLSDSDFTSLINYLSQNNSIKLNDTIIIKFDFNRESCWDILDQQDDSYIETVLNAHEKRISEALSIRPDISIFEYREAGNSINKLKKRNKNIRIDTGLLKSKLFKEKTICGSSAIILPNHQYLLIRSDAHFEAINLTTEQIFSKMGSL